MLESENKLAAHLEKANPQWRPFETAKEVLVVFQAEHALVSSRWYANTPNVPTWNYATVHAYGQVRLLDETQKRAQLETLTQYHEHAPDMAE
ncbi:MAG: FMN-binding negative transcriptional regulator [Deinococcales bacterium]